MLAMAVAPRTWCCARVGVSPARVADFDPIVRSPTDAFKARQRASSKRASSKRANSNGASPRVRRRSKEKPRSLGCGVLGENPGDDLLSHAECTLPSARSRFTSEFGMGSGGSMKLLSPGRGWRVADRCRFDAHTLSLVASERNRIRFRPWRISQGRSEAFVPNIDASSSPRPLEVIWSSHTDH